ncbi:MAG: hypothetical protein EVA89_18790 [Sandaracinaceae bacterium]|nr:MAG: hypothetical protein EVA89_18790 [Sandaracinaceae bacterium]
MALTTASLACDDLDAHARKRPGTSGPLVGGREARATMGDNFERLLIWACNARNVSRSNVEARLGLELFRKDVTSAFVVYEGESKELGLHVEWRRAADSGGA